MRIAIFQPDINNYPSIDSRLSKIKSIIQFSDSLDVLVLPELFLTFYCSTKEIISYSDQDIKEANKHILSLSSQFKCSIVFGYPEINDDIRFNSALITGSNGRILYNHRKTFLAPNNMEQELFSTGSDFEIFSIGDIKASLLICYEFEFPEIVRKLAKLGTQILFVPTALGEDFRFVAYEMLKTRAFENQIIIVYANYVGKSKMFSFCGNSAIVNEKGEDLLRLGDREEVAFIDVPFLNQDSRRKRLPYFKDLIKFEA